MKGEFQNYNLNVFYIYEVNWLAHAVVQQCENLFKITPVPEKGYSISPGYEAHQIITAILSDSARINNLLTIPAQKGRHHKSDKQFRLHVSRSEKLREYVVGLNISEIFSGKVRNTLQHFDEYLDEANLKSFEGRLNEHVMVSYNMIISHREGFQPLPFALRLYISSERVFLNMKYSVNIGKIYLEALELMKKFDEVLNAKGQEPSGILARIN